MNVTEAGWPGGFRMSQLSSPQNECQEHPPSYIQDRVETPMPAAGISKVSLSGAIRFVPLVKIVEKFKNILIVFNKLSIGYKHQKQHMSTKATIMSLEPRHMQV